MTGKGERAQPMGERIVKAALEVLGQEPEGIHYADLVRRIAETNRRFNAKTIEGNIWDLDVKHGDEVYKPSKGLFRLNKFREEGTDQLQEQYVPKPHRRIAEEEFYQPFADFLRYDLEECTSAIGLGGKVFGKKWGTPDVIGIWEPMKSDIVAPSVEVVSAEVKPVMHELIVAFGQACSYKLFSHKAYLVVPQLTPKDEKSRLISLCEIVGIGLVFFDSENAKEPQFTVRVQAIKHEPDMWYVNRVIRLVEKSLFYGRP